MRTRGERSGLLLGPRRCADQLERVNGRRAVHPFAHELGQLVKGFSLPATNLR